MLTETSCTAVVRATTAATRRNACAREWHSPSRPWSRVALMLTGCAGGIAESAGSDPNNPNQVEAITWWTSGIEKTALYDMVAVFKQRQRRAPVHRRVGERRRRRQGTRRRSPHGSTPTTRPTRFQAAAGAASHRLRRGRADLQDLTGFVRRATASPSVYRAALLELLSVDGKIYSVPSDIHRVNVLWTNNDAARGCRRRPRGRARRTSTPGSPTSRRSASPVSSTRSRSATTGPRSSCSRTCCSPTSAPFSTRTSGRARRTGKATGPAHRHRPLRPAARVRRPDGGSKEWNEATQLVVDGEAAYVMMADFALTSFQRAGFAYGKQYSAYPDPGHGRCLRLPGRLVHAAGRRRAREAARRRGCSRSSSAEGQKALSLMKGSIPARTDTVAEDYPPLSAGRHRIPAARHRRAVARARRRGEPDLDEGDHDGRRQVRRRRPSRGARERAHRRPRTTQLGDE